MCFFSFWRFVCTRLYSRYCLVLLICFSNNLSAQLWNGSLGAPVLNMAFSLGTQPFPYLSTSYTFAQGCPPPGGYSIESFLLYGCDGSTHQLTGDHTRDQGGNYLLVNADTITGNVLRQQVSGLCGSTTYQFAAFFSNVMKNSACGGMPVLPNVTLSIESLNGTVLASYNTGDLPVTDVTRWTEYGVYYRTPAIPEPLLVHITSTASGHCGNFFQVDDITLKPAGPEIILTVDGESKREIELCSGYTNPLLLQATYSNGYYDPVLQWQRSIDIGKTWQDIPGDTTDSYFIPRRKDSLIEYRLALAERTNKGNTTCTIYSKETLVTIHTVKDPDPLQKVQGCLDKNLLLNPPPDFYAYKWAGPNGFQSTAPKPVIKNVQYTDEGFYTVLCTGDYGCTVLDSFELKISPSTTIFTNTMYSVCEGTPVNLSATGDGVYAWTPATYLSNPSIPNPVASPTDSIQYKVVLTNSYGCKDSALVNINVFKKPVVSAGADKTILGGDTVLLDGSIKGTAVNYYWTTTGNVAMSQVLQPAVSPSVETSYSLYATSTVGCGNANSTVTIHVYKDVYMPSAFSPNADGINDVYHVFKLDSYQLISFGIYNRYGVKVFSTTNAGIGWDGTFHGEPQAAGNYVYYLEMKHASGKKITRKGSILLLR